MQGSALEAAEEFQRVLDHRGSDPFSAFHAAALVGIARARVMSGNITASVAAYRKFLDQWQAADSDVPLLLQVREEFQKLLFRQASSG